jgi:hypothetical protein
MHVNERERWTKELNSLNQFRLTIDVRTGKRTSIFAGPVSNVMISRLKNGDVIGSSIMPYTHYDETSTTADGVVTNVKMWLGFTAGIRL